MKRILLPTDFSENAYNAICYAVEFFKEEACEFYLLNTYTPVAYNVGSLVNSYSALQLQEIAGKNAQQGLDDIIAKLKKDFNNSRHEFRSIAVFNLFINEMLEVISENDIELVVMGTQGATGAKEVFMGTHTMFAIKKVKCPVLAVPSGFKYEAPKEILFPTDFRVNRTNRQLSLLKEISSDHNSRIHILNAYYSVPLDEKQKDIKSFLDAYFLDNAHLFHIAEGTDVLDAVETFQQKNKINLLVMIHNKHSFFENLLFKPVINQIVYHTKVPFLVIPSEERMMA